MKEIKKHLILWGILMKNSLMGQLEYRMNFFTGIAMELGYFLAKIVYMIVVYKTGVPINGLTPDEVLVFFGSYMIATGPYAGLYMMNLFGIGRQVQSGELDLLLVKPVSLQFILTLRRSDIALFTTDVCWVSWRWRWALPVWLCLSGCWMYWDIWDTCSWVP
jgi:ABC-2 type transport system permease protein